MNDQIDETSGTKRKRKKGVPKNKYFTTRYLTLETDIDELRPLQQHHHSPLEESLEDRQCL